jgi:hypothetical protein
MAGPQGDSSKAACEIYCGNAVSRLCSMYKDYSVEGWMDDRQTDRQTDRYGLHPSVLSLLLDRDEVTCLRDAEAADVRCKSSGMDGTQCLLFSSSVLSSC